MNSQDEYYYRHRDNRNNKMIKLKHTGLHKHISFKQPLQSSTPKHVKSSRRLVSTFDDDSKHLVKSISDLPVFVTIEGFRVASYSIGGEPYLCLPQLLRFLKRYFSIDKLIAKFEESVVSFPSATPKQVEGFVKSSVLPSSATSCPLIKRSDADKICLALYEQCPRAMRSDIVKLCSQKSTNFGEGSSDNVPSKTINPLQPPPPPPTTTIALQHSLFESEAQNSILFLARAITSTLIIRVYHKCFGKCLGLYYPSLLSNSNSKCIECASCKMLLSPRRFIGHTHGSKENDVCHWGFDSYNWRSYIRLSREQPKNNLDDDELLIKFRTLLSVPDDDTSENDYDFDKQESDENSNSQTARQHKRKYTASSLTPTIEDTSQVLGSSSVYDHSSNEILSPMYLPLPDKVNLCSTKSSLGISLPTVSVGLTDNVMQPIDVHHQLNPPQQQQVIPLPPSASQQLAFPHEYYNFPWTPLAEQARQLQPPIYSSSFSGYRDRSQPPLMATKRSSSFSTSDANTCCWSPSRSTPVAGPANMLNTDQITRQLSLDSETKREIYICNNLTPYLGNKGLSTGFINDIVETTLNIVRRSKTLI